MPKYEVELGITILTKKRGYFLDSKKEKIFHKNILVTAETQESAEELALDRVLLKTPGFSLGEIIVNSCKLKNDPDRYTVTVTGIVHFKNIDKSNKKGYFKDISLEYVYSKSEVSNQDLMDHAESRFRIEVSNMPDFHYVDSIERTILSPEVEEFIQI